MKIGIDKIGFYAPHLYVDMNDLANARGDEPAKYTIGLGQDEMAIAPLTQDPVTLAANAAWNILDDEDRKQIDYVMFATETGVDHSKAASVYVHRLLGLRSDARSIELKQACYAATAALQLARGHITLNPQSKVLVLASDIARYGLNTPGEVTQGAGAVAFVVSADPNILVMDEMSTSLTRDIMDFWRPIYSEYAFVDGKFSNESYIEFFESVWNKYQQKSGLHLSDFEAICFHLPYTKMGKKALEAIYPDGLDKDENHIMKNYEVSTKYSRKIGNIYTASLYLGFISLLDQKELQSGSKIGFYSYGSGAVGEFFSGELQAGYCEHLYIDQHLEQFNRRKNISIDEYEDVFKQSLPVDGSTVDLDINEDPAPICLAGVSNHERKYVNKLTE